jgi:hypothetical protein
MADLALIRQGLADNLSAIDGLHVTAYLISKPLLPAAEIEPAGTTYDIAGSRGLDRWKFLVRVFVGLTSDKHAQQRLDLMLAGSGDGSVKEAIEADTTLGGTVDDLRVTSVSGYRIYGAEKASPVLGAEWAIEVLSTP